MSVVINPALASQTIVYYNAKTSPAVMTNDLSIFNVSGDVLIFAILSACYTANGATASTLQYTSTNNTTTTTGNMSGVSASLANAAIGVSAIAQLGAVTNAPTLTTASGVGVFPWGAIRLPGNSTIKLVIGTGSTTGTWVHYVHWQPLEDGAIITPAF